MVSPSKQTIIKLKCLKTDRSLFLNPAVVPYYSWFDVLLMTNTSQTNL